MKLEEQLPTVISAVVNIVDPPLQIKIVMAAEELVTS